MRSFRDSSGEREYDVMQVCESGHMITAYAKTRPQDRREYCEKCGAPTIVSCKNCGAEIPGHEHIPGHVYPDYSEPSEFCGKCGKPFPWKVTASDRPLPTAINGTVRLLSTLDRFHSVAKQLSQRHAGRGTILIQDEYDVQDLLLALVRYEFDDVRPEEWTPSYAGGSSRMDFLLKNEKTVVEVKKTREGLKDKDIGDQLLIDVARYKTHPDCQTLVCFVYDPEGHISNPIGLESDLATQSAKNLKVVVRIRPR